MTTKKYLVVSRGTEYWFSEWLEIFEYEEGYEYKCMDIPLELAERYEQASKELSQAIRKMGDIQRELSQLFYDIHGTPEVRISED